jgi:hypothetical protein
VIQRENNWTQLLRVGKIPDTQFPNPNYPNPDPKYPYPNYTITISDSDCKNPKLVWVIRVMFSGTRTTRITRNISNIYSSIPNIKTWGSSMPYKYIIWHKLMYIYANLINDLLAIDMKTWCDLKDYCLLLENGTWILSKWLVLSISGISGKTRIIGYPKF